MQGYVFRYTKRSTTPGEVVGERYGYIGIFLSHADAIRSVLYSPTDDLLELIPVELTLGEQATDDDFFARWEKVSQQQNVQAQASRVLLKKRGNV